MIRYRGGERVFEILNTAFLTLFTVAVLVPVIYVLKQSLDVGAQGELTLSLIPREFSLFYYRFVLNDTSIWRPFLNTIILTIVGTTISLAIETTGAYALSHRQLPGNRLFTYMLLITMMFSGGLVPLYLLVRGLGLIDEFPWVLILPFAASAWNVFLIRNYYYTVPPSLRESAKMDGAPELVIYGRIVLPLSVPVIAAIGLFTGVNYWNTFFSAIIFINSPTKYTFAVKLREILVQQMERLNEFERMAVTQSVQFQNLDMEGMYSAIIILSMVPIVVIYPLLQKHFVKGILVGSIKG